MITLLLPAIVSAVLGLLGFAINWMFDLVEWNIAIVGIIALTACVIIAFMPHIWVRLLISVALALIMYIHGALDRQAQLVVEFKAKVEQIHGGYAAVSAEEKRRQQAVNDEAQQRAAVEKEKQDAELALRDQEINLLREQAARDAHAKRPAFSVDAVKRLNDIRLRRRHGPQS